MTTFWPGGSASETLAEDGKFRVNLNAKCGSGLWLIQGHTLASLDQ